MTLPTIIISLTGLAIGLAISFCLARQSVRTWIAGACAEAGADHIAAQLRRRAFGTLGWTVLGLGVLVAVDIAYFSRAGTLYEVFSACFRDYPNNGSPAWALWGGAFSGLILGVGLGGFAALRRFDKCRHVSWRHLVLGHR
jgi:hypothetical protein